MTHGPTQAIFGLGRPVSNSGLLDESEDNDLAAIFADTGNAGIVDKMHLSGSFLKVVTLPGQDETGDATIDVTGMASGDELVYFGVLATAASIATLTTRALTDFTVGANVLTVGANAANNTNNQYLVIYLDLT